MAIKFENFVIPEYEAAWWGARDHMQQDKKPTGIDIEQLLLDCIGTPSKEKDTLVIRYNKFQTAAVAFAQGDLSSWTAKSASLLKTYFVDNEQELCLYRVHAARLLAHYSAHKFSPQEAIAHHQLSLNLYDTATPEDRRKVVQKMTVVAAADGSASGRFCTCPKDSSVGAILDDIRRSAEDDMNYEKEQYAYVKGMFESDLGKSLGVQGEFFDEMLQKIPEVLSSIPGARSMEDFCPVPPTVTSAVIEQIKSLPVNDDMTLLITCDNSPFMVHPYRDGDRLFRAMAVNMKRFRSGKKTKVFKQVKMLIFEPKERKCRQKNLLSTFIASCLEPYVVIRGSRQGMADPSRPCKVLFETASDLHDPQVQMFMSMMGCSSEIMEVANPRLLHLLYGTMLEVNFDSMKNVFNKKDTPHLWDKGQHIMCGNCGKVGPTLKLCTCRKAYYCCAECQKAQWSAHKSDHKTALLRKRNSRNGQV